MSRAAPPGVQKIVVQDVSFALQAGNGLGIIGPSASGKSSLARLLVGVWQPVRGNVRLDGAALDQWMPEALGRHIGYLPQDVELLAGTVAQNISRFERDADPGGDRQRGQGRRRARPDRAICRKATRPQVGEQGSALSAGQAQRIALARALYRDPFLVVLDEPNSNLDSEGDEALARAVIERAQARRHRRRRRASAERAGGGRSDPGHGQGPHAASVGPKDEVLAKVLQRPAAAAPAQGRPRDRESARMKQRNPPRSPRSAGTSSPASSSSACWCVGVGGWAGTTQIVRRADRAGLRSWSIPTSRRCSTRPAASSAKCACATATASRSATSWCGSTTR